jgi:hypothetical protein
MISVREAFLPAISTWHPEYPLCLTVNPKIADVKHHVQGLRSNARAASPPSLLVSGLVEY